MADLNKARRSTLRRGRMSVWIVIVFTISLATDLVPALGAGTPPGIAGKVYFMTYGWSRSARFDSPAGVFFNARKGEVYVADSGKHEILVFDTVGTPITRIRHYVDGKKPGDSAAGEPKQVAVNSGGDIFVVDALAPYLDVLDHRGRQLKRVYPGDLLKLPREAARCTAVGIDHADNVYLGTGGEECAVLVLDRDLRLARRIGKKGTGEGGFQAITGIWVDAAGRTYVTDALARPSVQVFSSDGKQVLSFGEHSAGPNNFSLPQGVVTDDLGDIYVLDGLRQVIAVFGPDGQYLTRLGGFGSAPGDLAYPTGIAGDGKRTFFTVERVGARLQGFKLDMASGS